MPLLISTDDLHRKCTRFKTLRLRLPPLSFSYYHQCVLSIQMMRDLEVWNTNIQKSNNNRLLHVSVLPFEMTTIEPGDGEIPTRTLSWKPLDFLNHIKLLTMDTDRFPLSLWELCIEKKTKLIRFLR
jgi:hypothetical protein